MNEIKVDNKKRKFDIGNLIYVALIIVVLLFGMNRLGITQGFLAGTNTDTMRQLGLEYYMDHYGEQVGAEEPEAVIRNFGCHREIHIYEGDQLKIRLSFFNGRVSEI
ncbi:hypothetical protein EDC18_102168 [Natranaerovirga pectinivora]|uniref:Uncharacterized protein n=1 Tax=Natranaerovirga pectinivora TaxID=682400 RepID=A0A4R3MNR4_9FIRM|nr:hypothetical protein [Natranaerovirga pectinivora]TCT16152.1 hypothetical protein EDC18_102168 [Natranaerovirga pectinivora]